MNKKEKNSLFEYASSFFYDELSPKFRRSSFKNIMDYAYIIFEKIAINFEFLRLGYINIYKELVKKEVNNVNIKPKNSVLVIGCGSIPTTTLLIFKYSNSKRIVSIDRDSKAIKNSLNLIKKSDLYDNLQFEQADGINYPIEDFDFIFVLYGIKKQKKLLEYISKNMGKDSRILFRTTNAFFIKSLGGKDFLSTLFNIEKSIIADRFDETISFVLKKK